jgi:hypothetical protein
MLLLKMVIPEGQEGASGGYFVKPGFPAKKIETIIIRKK